ncbi:MAG: putative toxin-antitoxin system toxin component, PIN family [Lentisphaerae bacterium]|nr:putative toxin-antitoxin system toxin component, PIN family [Lentisphaerota bacterium]
MKRIVCDTNVLVSGFLWDGKPRRLLADMETEEICAFTSRELLDELDRVLRYPKLVSVLRRAGIARQDILRWVVRHTMIVMPKPLESVVIGADPSDDRVLACAVSASAETIVSGDRHLLDLGAFRGIPIVTATAFLKKA